MFNIWYVYIYIYTHTHMHSYYKVLSTNMIIIVLLYTCIIIALITLGPSGGWLLAGREWHCAGAWRREELSREPGATTNSNTTLLLHHTVLYY